MPVLTHANLLPVFLAIFAMLSAGFLLKASIRTSGAYLGEARGLSAWWAVPALGATFFGAPEVLGIGALGAQTGWLWAGAFVAGAAPALLVAGLWSGTRLLQAQVSTPAAFLGLRFGRGARIVGACGYVLLSVGSVAIGLAVVGRTMESLHILDGLVRGRGWTVQSIYPGVVTISAMVVLLAVVWGGFAGSLRSRSVLFCFLLAGLLPLTLHGADHLGGFAALRISLGAERFPLAGLAHPLVACGLGVVVGAALGCADFRFLQILVNCRDRATVRRVSWFALLPLLGIGWLAVLPGAIAPQMPTPRTTVTQSEIEGAIVRITTVARPEEEAGRGLVPAQMNTVTGRVIRRADGSVLLESTMGAPKLAVKSLGEGGLGMFLAALLAALLSGASAHLTAANALVAGDVFPLLQKQLPDDQLVLRRTRWTAVGTMALAAALALVLRGHGPSATPLLAGSFLAVTVLLAAMSLLLAAVHVPTAKGGGTSRKR